VNTAAPSAAMLGAWGLVPAWSRTIDVPSHDGATRRWHLLDRPAAAAADGAVEGATVVCLHGNPTWSFLWSRLLAELAPQHRVIAPDQLSMGWSQRIARRSYRERVLDLADLLDALDVRGPVWLVAQDWGGAVAMGFAVAHPERVAGMVLSNTGIAVPEGRKAPWLIKLAATSGLHRFSTRTTPLFVRGTPWLPGGHLTRAQRRALAAPYRAARLRDGVADFVADVPFQPSHPSAADIAAVADELPSLTIPVRLVWGARDPVFNDDFAEDLRARFADVELHRVRGAGHLAVLEVSLAPFVEAAIAGGSGVSAPVAAEVDVAAPLWGLIDEPSAATGPSAIAVSDAAADESIDRAQFAGRVAAFAQGLHHRGVQPGDRVAVLVPPGIDLIAVIYACWRLGAVTVVADRGLGLRGLGAAVRSARVRHVVGPPAALAAAATLRWAPGATRLPLHSLRDTAAPDRLDQLTVPMPAAADPAAVVFTSGATGPAKGVRYTHGQLHAQRDALRALYDITPEDRFVAAFAPFSVFGPALGIGTGLADNEVTSPGTLTAAALDDACRRVGATMVFASPAALANVVRTASGPLPSLAKVRLVMSAGAPVPIDTLRAMARLCPKASLHTPYGMTEILPVADISLVAREAVGAGRGVCVGAPVPGCDVVVTDPGDLSSLPVGSTGEVVVCAPWMSQGYDRLWHTQQLARPTLDDARIWHRTGDIGHLDEAGNLWIEGRVVHLIHTADGPVAPVPLEIAAESVPGVRRAAAVGIGPHGVQQVAIVVEVESSADAGPGAAPSALAAAVRAAILGPNRPGDRDDSDTEAEVGRFGHRSPSGQAGVAAVWVADRLPVDIRHNAKIDRTALAATMERVLAGGRW